MTQLTHLFAPIKVGNVELKNRMVMLAIGTGYPEPDGTVGDRFSNFCVERAKGGVGLIITPFAPFDMATSIVPGLFDDRFIPGARRLTDAVHAYGTKIAPQFLGQYFWVNKENGSFEKLSKNSAFLRSGILLLTLATTRSPGSLSFLLPYPLLGWKNTPLP